MVSGQVSSPNCCNVKNPVNNRVRKGQSLCSGSFALVWTFSAYILTVFEPQVMNNELLSPPEKSLPSGLLFQTDMFPQNVAQYGAIARLRRMIKC
jgi:hypothetical protein